MATALSLAMDLAEGALAQTSSEAVGAAYLKALEPLGAKSLWARQFHLTPNWVDPKVSATYKTYDYACIRQANWWGSAAQRYSDTVCPVSIGASQFTGPYFTSDVAGTEKPAYGAYWDAMAEFGVADTLAIPYFGPNNTAAGITIWMTHRDFSPDEVKALRLSITLVFDRMRVLKEPLQTPCTPLSTRERHALALVAEGKSDAEISVLLGIAKTTAHAHIENAKRKLGARTRAQAVAQMVLNAMA